MNNYIKSSVFIFIVIFNVQCKTLKKNLEKDSNQNLNKNKYVFITYSYEQYQAILKKQGPIIERMQSPHSDIIARNDSIVIITKVAHIVHNDTILNPFRDGYIIDSIKKSQ